MDANDDWMNIMNKWILIEISWHKWQIEILIRNDTASKPVNNVICDLSPDSYWIRNIYLQMCNVYKQTNMDSRKTRQSKQITGIRDLFSNKQTSISVELNVNSIYLWNMSDRSLIKREDLFPRNFLYSKKGGFVFVTSLHFELWINLRTK